METLDLSIVMPCLNEEATVGVCIEEARRFMKRNALRGEILVVDNGSSDASARIAGEHGAVVICEMNHGYGWALRTGIDRCRGEVILMGDSDTTYDFGHLEVLYEPLKSGEYDMMIGNRFGGEMEKGAMPVTHKIGVRVLSALGRWRTGTNVQDFHCGIRGLTKRAARRLTFHTTGMEFATEMIAAAAREGLRIGQASVPLRRCRYPRKSKLEMLPDGFRHLKYLFWNFTDIHSTGMR